jgi:hypothetical protein
MTERYLCSPAIPTFTPAPALAQVDVGPVIAEVARMLWSQIEQRAGLSIDIAAAGPVVADEMQLHRLLRLITQYVLERVPESSPAEHLVGFATRALHDDTLVIDVRHVQRNWRRGPAAPSELAIDLDTWRALADQFSATVEQIDDLQARQCFRIKLRAAF